MTIVEAYVVSSPTRRFCWIPSPAVEETGPEPPINRLPGFDDTEQRCWQAFLESSALLLETLDRQLMKVHRLGLFDFLVLDMLARSNGGSARMGDLAEALAVGPSRMTQQIRRMESEGLVRRSRSTRDKRGVIATVTREGRLRLQPATKTYAGHIREHYLNQMTRQQMIAMGDSCRRISQPLNNSQVMDRFKPL
ncbi:MarR family transcriptional regulator [Mycobacterium interjectum]|nr:MarR family transcriptional regulator [Mycobacterium interjectum]